MKRAGLVAMIAACGQRTRPCPTLAQEEPAGTQPKCFTPHHCHMSFRGRRPTGQRLAPSSNRLPISAAALVSRKPSTRREFREVTSIQAADQTLLQQRPYQVSEDGRDALQRLLGLASEARVEIKSEPVRPFQRNVRSASLRSHRPVETCAEVGGIGVDVLRAADEVVKPYQGRPVRKRVGNLSAPLDSH